MVPARMRGRWWRAAVAGGGGSRGIVCPPRHKGGAEHLARWVAAAHHILTVEPGTSRDRAALERTRTDKEFTDA